MASGGARSRSGPPPDPNALRRDRKDDADWLTLPAGVREDEPPEWPLAGCTAREAELWAKMWAKPQGHAWEKLGLEFEVGLMVRRMAEAELPASHTSTGTLVRQMMDSLGLTVPGMRSNRWKLADDELAEKREETAPAGSSRDRFRVVTDGAA